jgi:hypothetical protein
VAYCGAMIWQLVQVDGSSPRYEYAFDILNINIPSPANIPSAIRTGNFHWSGGMNFLKRFMPDITGLIHKLKIKYKK